MPARGSKEDCEMAYIKRLDVNYHQQDQEGYCGAACAQIVLHTIPFNQPLISQGTLNNSIQALGYEVEGPIWFAEPGGLERALNENKGAVTGWEYNLLPFDNEPSVTRHIILSIESLSVPVIALVYGFKHWVVVCGFKTDIRPQSTGGFAIEGLYLHDPSPVVQPYEHLPPPHKDGNESDGCGIGGKRGTSREFVTYDHWRGTSALKGYMTGIPNDLGSKWKGKFLAISAERTA